MINEKAKMYTIVTLNKSDCSFVQSFWDRRMGERTPNSDRQRIVNNQGPEDIIAEYRNALKLLE